VWVQISESDVLLATASDAIVIGFNVRPSLNAKKIADTENIEIKLYSIIYNAIEEIKAAMEGLLEPKIEEKIIGNLDVRKCSTSRKWEPLPVVSFAMEEFYVPRKCA
jgi:translation initiation factor IF-2